MGRVDGESMTAARDVTDLQRAATEQAALRRIATLAAEGVQPADLFAVVAKEVARVFEVPLVRVMRYEAGEAVTECASFLGEGTSVPFGSRSSLEGTNVLRLVRDTSKAARIDDYSGLEGEIAEGARSSWIRSAVGSPIVVAGQPWGAVVASSPVQLPDGTEQRLADFTDLLATVIDNAASREALTRLAEEQAALRRVATLVARGAPSPEIFAAVTEELGRLVPVGQAAMSRYDPDEMFTTVAVWCMGPSAFAVGERETPGGHNVMSMVLETGRPVRIDDYSEVSGPIGEAARAAGYQAAVGTPIVVEGRLWGIMTAASSRPEPLPPDTEARLASFTELVATAIANAESRSGLARLAEEQAAQRRVAVLVAREASPDEVFTAVTEAVGGLLGADITAMHTFSDDGMATTVAGWSKTGPMLPVGTRLPLEGDSVTARIFHSGAPARMDTYVDVGGQTAEIAQDLRLRSTVGAPILADGRLWGALVASTRGPERFPEDAETRIAAFTELVATAISNTQARESVARLATEQAALRRVATLVAQGVQPVEIFSAVSVEIDRLVGAAAAVLKFEQDGAAVVVGVSSGFDVAIGTRLEFEDWMAPAEVYRTWRSSRVDALDSTVASPIVVDGRLWGAMTVSSPDESLPLDAEERLEKFTELIATAIANADSKAELAASRRRIVAASDEARRRIERDLHDGTQQRLVALVMAVRAAEDALPPDSPIRSELSRIATALADAMTELRELSRGIHPAILAQGGLGAAMGALARRSTIPVELDVDTDTRLPAALEVATYYITSEALANAAKHAQASCIYVSLAPRNGTLQLSISDDGIGGADPVHGSGLVGLADRVEALGGSIHVRSRAGEGTQISVELPLELEVSETLPR